MKPDMTAATTPRLRPSAATAGKAHVAVDQGLGLVRQAVLTLANVADKAPFLDLV